MNHLNRDKVSIWQKLWAIGCSLKLAIYLATAATLLIMGGSLVMHFNPRIFAGMEQEIMGIWLPWAWTKAPHLAWWVPASGVCILLFAVNTLCCLIDWLLKIKARWRKTGEYLIHAGFILLTIAYIWGNTAGFRSGPHKFSQGERKAVPNMSGYELQLDQFTPKVEPSGRPLDMISEVSLFKDNTLVSQATVRINHPLIYDGLVILPASYGQELYGFRFNLIGHGLVNLTSGSTLPASANVSIKVHQLLPDARQNSQGKVMQVGSRLNNPAMQISILDKGETTWTGWYFLRNRPPAELIDAGVIFRPIEPLFRSFSLLTINRDPGDKVALLGSIFISVGVIFAFFSFYRKRAQGDRPEI